MSKPIYRVQFVNNGEIFTLFVKHIYQSEMFGFITLEKFVFGSQNAVVIDPSEERLRNEFENIKKSFIPMHAIIRVDEVSESGTAKISDVSKNIAQFPNSIYSHKE